MCHRWPSVMALVLAASVGAVATVGVTATAPDQRVRSIRASGDRTIASQLRSGDTEVHVVAMSTPPLGIVPGEGDDAAALLAGFSDAVLRLHVAGLDSRLSDSGAWVKTTVRARVDEVVKPDEGVNLTVGDEVRFELQGGEVMIGSVKVRGVLPWSRAIAAGRNYLVFLDFIDDGSLLVAPSTIFEDTSEGLVALQTKGPERSLRLGPMASVVARLKVRSQLLHRSP